MSRGSRTMLSPFAIHSTRMAIAASPAPRKAAFCRNSSRTTTLPPSMMRVYGTPVATTFASAPMMCRMSGAKATPATPNTIASASPRRTACAAATDPARHHGRDDAQPHREDQRQHRLGQRHPRHRLVPELGDEVDVDDREERLHHHLQHHRHGEENDRAPDRAAGRVAPGATHGVHQDVPPGLGRRC